MQEFKHDSNTIRIHGNVDRDQLKRAAEEFMKKVERQRYEQKKKNLQKNT